MNQGRKGRNRSASSDSLEKDKIVELLTTEHTRLAEEIESAYSQVNQISALAASFLGVTIGLVTSLTVTDPILLWVTPAAALVVFGFALTIGARWQAHLFQIRLVCDRLCELTGESPIMFYEHEESIVSRFYSLRSGNAKYKIMVFTLFATVIVLFVYLVSFSFEVIYASNHFSGFLFIIFYTLLSMIYLLGFFGIVFDFPVLFNDVVKQFKSSPTELPEIRSLLKSGAKPIEIFLPRPLDFFSKNWLFLVGAMAALWEKGPSFNPRIWELFVTQKSTSPPLWTIIAFALCWYVIQEGLVQQAKYIWNDLRDREIDKYIKAKRHRTITSGAMGLGGAITQLVIRWVGGLLLGLLLDYRLFWLLFTISVVHILYELWAKPRGDTEPVAAMVLVALGSPLRVLGGALAVSKNLQMREALFMISFLFLGVGYIANYWKIEAEHTREQDLSVLPRPQSEYFFKNGESWQHIGFSGLLICTIMSVIDALLCSGSNVCLNNYALFWRSSVPSKLAFVVTSLVVLIVVLVVTWVMHRPFTKLLLCFSERNMIARMALLALLISAITYYARFSREILLSSFMVLFTVAAFNLYENIDYNKYMLVHLRKNIKVIAHLWFIYFFNSKSSMPFLSLAKMTVTLSQNDIDIIRNQVTGASPMLKDVLTE